MSSTRVPPWARPPASWLGGTAGTGYTQHLANRRDVRAADRGGRRIDVAVYGDSITAGIRGLMGTAAGRRMVRDALGDGVVPLGAPGNAIEDLTWRLMVGGEKPRLDPRVVVLWIGTNNVGVTGTDPAPKLDFLLGWMASAMPLSRIVVLNALRTTAYDTRAANEGMRRVAVRRGVAWSDCGGALDPARRDLFADGLHPTPRGYEAVFRCLGPLVRELVRAQA